MAGIETATGEILFQTCIRKLRRDIHGMWNRWQLPEKGKAQGQQEQKEGRTGRSGDAEARLMREWSISFLIVLFGAFTVETLQMYSWNIFIMFLGIGMNIGAWTKWKRNITRKLQSAQ